MIDLGQRSEAYEITLPYGLLITVKPLTTASMATAQAAARRAVEVIERQIRERREAGLTLDGLPHLSAEGECDGFYQAQLIRELVLRHGCRAGGGPAPPTPKNVAAVMELYPVGERFFQEFTLRQVLLNAAKRIRALCRRQFQPGGGPEYCRACRDEGPPLWPRRARGRRTALPLSGARLDFTRQEHEAWDVLLACQGQLRLAPSGDVTGIDMDVALSLASARGR